MSQDKVQLASKGGIVAIAVVCAFILAVANLPTKAQQTATKQVSTEPSQQPRGKSFGSPEAAAAALYAAARKNDDNELLLIFGPGAKEIVFWTDDPAERQARREEFARKYDQMHRLVREPDNTVALYVGAENWPIPIPLVEYKGAWYFDADLGKQEIVYRRVGRNEIEALEVCHALVDAEKDYFAGAHEYAAKFVSSAGMHDGLYWEARSGSSMSPIGPYLAHAGIDASGEEHGRPYHGYYYRILPAQGAAASGGARDYVENGKMTGGFAILAFPAEYHSSGVMTFMMDQNGNAYEKDLGSSTTSLAKEISSFNPDGSWKKVE